MGNWEERNWFLPCVFVVMLDMPTHNENLTRVQEALWYLINDEDVKQVLEAMIDKMKELGDNSERLKQWREEAKAYIPADQKYDENYWVAAYILYSNNPAFINYAKELGSIKSRMKTLRNDLNRLNKIEKETWNKIQELYEKIKPFQEQIENLEEQLETIEEVIYSTSNYLYDLQNEYKRLLERLREVRKQIVI